MAWAAPPARPARNAAKVRQRSEAMAPVAGGEEGRGLHGRAQAGAVERCRGFQVGGDKALVLALALALARAAKSRD